LGRAEESSLDELASAVLTGSRYRHMDPGLVRRIGAQELAKGRGLKEAVKATRSKLHQVGGAYQEQPIAYEKALAGLETLPHDLNHPDVQAFCQQMMRQHASTRERLPVLPEFYAAALEPVGPVHSVLDLACGLNPLAAPWMPRAADFSYFACDIYLDLADFLTRFFAQMGVPGEASVCDLLQGAPAQPVQLALLLKTLPCLEQVDKAVTPRLLASIQAEHILISFPARSLGGRSKGMPQNYEAHFLPLISLPGRTVRRFEFSSELAYLVSAV